MAFLIAYKEVFRKSKNGTSMGRPKEVNGIYPLALDVESYGNVLRTSTADLSRTSIRDTP